MIYKNTFRLFSGKEGAQHIASELTLKKIQEITIKKNLSTIFEFGIGIGTIPYLLSRLDKSLVYFGTENNEFCINALKKNLTSISDSFNFNHLSNYKEFQGDMKFDLIIMDGDFENEDFLKRITHKKSIIIIEGDRKKQQSFVKATFPRSLHAQVITLDKNQQYSPFFNKENNHYIGGYTIFYLNPTIFNKIRWLFTKAATSLKYKLRKI